MTAIIHDFSDIKRRAFGLKTEPPQDVVVPRVEPEADTIDYGMYAAHTHTLSGAPVGLGGVGSQVVINGEIFTVASSLADPQIDPSNGWLVGPDGYSIGD